MAISLGEILSAKGDADYAQGGYGGGEPVFNNALTQSYLQQLGDIQARANQYLLEQHDANLKSALANLDNVDTKGVLPTDNDALMQQYSGVLQNAAGNFGVLRNPMSNPQEYARLKTAESGFRRNLSQSQQDAAYLATQQKFVETHPEFNTPEYEQNVKDFLAAPVGKRKYFTVSPPLVFNPEALGKTFSELAKKKYSNASTDGKYLTTEEGEKIDRDKYFKLWENPGQDKYGRQVEASILNSYNSLPANLKPLYKDYNDYKRQMAEHNIGLDQVTKKSINEDQYGTIAASGKEQRKNEAQREAFQARQNNLDRAIQWAKIKQDGEVLKKGQIDKNTIGEYKNNLVYTLFTGDSNEQNIPNEVLQDMYGDNTKVKIKTGNSTLGEPEVEVEKPLLSVVGNYVQDGKAVIMRRNNKTGKLVNNLRLSFDKVYNDFDQIKGTDNAPTVLSASREWLKKTTGSEKPSLDALDKAFKSTVASPVKPGTLSDDAYQEFLRKNGLK